MTYLEAKTKLKKLGYDLKKNQKDCMGYSHAFKTVPKSGCSGSTNYFPDMTSIEKYIRDVANIRRWQQ